MQLDQLPILGISGPSGVGKTTLIEKLICHFNEQKLKVAVAKHGGRDSGFQLARMTRNHDLVLVEGCKDERITKLVLHAEGESPPLHNKDKVLGVLKPGQDITTEATHLADQWLKEVWQQPPVYGCVLIGGKSSRMGQPKHLLTKHGKTWLQSTVERLNLVCSTVLVAGMGLLPEGSSLDRLVDPPGLQGPMAGIQAALSWNPWASWLITACDQPDMEIDALQWLLDQRQPGTWGVLPTMQANGPVEPLLAYYDGRLLSSLEEMAAMGRVRPSELSNHPKTVVLEPPAPLKRAWRNVNSPEDIYNCSAAPHI